MEKTVLVGVITNDQGVEKSMDYLDELAFLTKTAGGSVYKVFTQKLNNPNPKTFIGEGKINEMSATARKHGKFGGTGVPFPTEEPNEFAYMDFVNYIKKNDHR